MSGFTTGAAFTIGLSQLRAGFGFALNPPQQGGEVEYNYEIVEWWLDNWYELDKKGHRLQNVYATTVRGPSSFSHVLSSSIKLIISLFLYSFSTVSLLHY